LDAVAEEVFQMLCGTSCNTSDFVRKSWLRVPVAPTVRARRGW